MRPDRAAVARVVLATLIVMPSVYLWQRCSTNEDTIRALQHGQMVMAAARIDSEIAGCEALNGMPKAFVQAALKTTTTELPDSARIALRSTVERAVVAANRPKVCTVASLHLEPLADLAAGRRIGP